MLDQARVHCINKKVKKHTFCSHLPKELHHFICLSSVSWNCSEEAVDSQGVLLSTEE